MTAKKEKSADRVAAHQYRMKAYQVLAHLYFSEHSFYEYLGSKTIAFKSSKLTALTRMNTRDLYRKLEFLKTKGFIADYSTTYGHVTVKLKNPPVLYNARDLQDEHVPSDFGYQAEISVTGEHVGVDIIPEPVVKVEKVWNQETLKFD